MLLVKLWFQERWHKGSLVAVGCCLLANNPIKVYFCSFFLLHFSAKRSILGIFNTFSCVYSLLFKLLVALEKEKVTKLPLNCLNVWIVHNEVSVPWHHKRDCRFKHAFLRSGTTCMEAYWNYIIIWDLKKSLRSRLSCSWGLLSCHWLLSGCLINNLLIKA